MPTVNFTIKYGKNQGLVISPSDLIMQYLYGLPLCTRDGKHIDNSVYVQKILSIQARIQKYLMVKLQREVVEEDRDYQRGEYMSWGFIKLNYPIREALKLTGFLGSVQQTEFPFEWMSRSNPSDENDFNRTLHVVPIGLTSTQNAIAFLGIFPNLSYLGVDNIPNYWRVEYATGFMVVPDDIIDAIGKMVAIEMLAILGDLVLSPGISSTSLSFDGLSESLSSTKSGQTSAYSARMKQYSDDLKVQLPSLKDYYKGLTFTAM